MDFESVVSYLGIILEVMGILSLVPVIVSAAYGDGLHFVYIIAGILAFATGTVLDKRFRKNELSMGSAMAITALGFVLISLFGSIPYMTMLGPVDAVFESVSGFTTTGLSVINSPELMPHSLLFWRSFTQWIGGIGILIIIMMLISSPGMSSYYLYKAEGGTEKIEANMKHSVRKIFKIYGLYTAVGIVLLSLAGVGMFDSLLLSFSSISTGGFAPHSESIAHYGSGLVQLIIIFLMICGATSFFVHDRILRGKVTKIRQKASLYLGNPETRFFWILSGIFIILLTVSLWGISSAPLSDAIFQTFSAITTTGFTTIGLTGLEPAMFLIILLMIIGGYAGSTSGGIKLVRMGIIGKSFIWLGKRLSYPVEAVIPFKLGKKVVHDRELSMIFLFVSVYVVLMVVSGIVLLLLGYGPMDAFFSVSSAQGTVGFATVDMAAMAWQGKILLMINMLLGRLEIFPFLVLFYTFITGLASDKE